MKKIFLALMAVAAIALTGCKDKQEPKEPQDPQPQERQIDPDGKAAMTLCFYTTDTVAMCMDFKIVDVTHTKTYTEEVVKRAFDTTNVNDYTFYKLIKTSKCFHGVEHVVALELPLTLAAGKHNFQISGIRNSTVIEASKIDVLLGNILIFDINNPLLDVQGGEAIAVGLKRTDAEQLQKVFNSSAAAMSLQFSFNIYKK